MAVRKIKESEKSAITNKVADIFIKEKSEIEKLKKTIEIIEEIGVKFGRYLLKEATHHWDKDATLCWKVENEEYDTLHLFEKFMNEYI